MMPFDSIVQSALGFFSATALADCEQLCIEFSTPARISHALAKAHRIPRSTKRFSFFKAAMATQKVQKSIPQRSTE